MKSNYPGVLIGSISFVTIDSSFLLIFFICNVYLRHRFHTLQLETDDFSASFVTYSPSNLPELTVHLKGTTARRMGWGSRLRAVAPEIGSSGFWPSDKSVQAGMAC